MLENDNLMEICMNTCCLCNDCSVLKKDKKLFGSAGAGIPDVQQTFKQPSKCNINGQYAIGIKIFYLYQSDVPAKMISISPKSLI